MLNKHTIARLIIYNRILKDLYRNGRKNVTSNVIAKVLSKTPAQVRRDLSNLGRRGKPGVGYDIKNLIDNIDGILGLKRTWGVMLIGAGNLGRALLYYPGFKREGFEFRIVVDNDIKKIGKKLNGIVVSSPRTLKNKIKQNNIKIAIIAVPEEVAQRVTDKITDTGIREILNFAPVTLNVPDNVNVRYADLALELENLSYYLSMRKPKKRIK